jgi:hypothetical protein
LRLNVFSFWAFSFRDIFPSRLTAANAAAPGKVKAVADKVLWMKLRLFIDDVLK